MVSGFVVRDAPDADDHMKPRLAEPDLSDGVRGTIARTLRRHFTAADDAAGWWWGEFQPTERWLRTGADLGVLADVSGPRTARLAEAVTRVSRTPTGCQRSWLRVTTAAALTTSCGSAGTRSTTARPTY